MEILLIIDTYLSWVSFGGAVIKTNSDNGGELNSRRDQSGARAVRRRSLSPCVCELNRARGGQRGSLQSHSVDHQLTCVVFLLMRGSPWHRRCVSPPRWPLTGLLAYTSLTRRVCVYVKRWPVAPGVVLSSINMWFGYWNQLVIRAER